MIELASVQYPSRQLPVLHAQFFFNLSLLSKSPKRHMKEQKNRGPNFPFITPSFIGRLQ